MKPRSPLHWLIAVLLALSTADHTLVAKAATPARPADKGASRVAEQTQSGDRLALVIGNKDYASAPLQNPVNDARDIKAALEQVGFRVIYRENATKLKIVEAVREFKSGLGPDSVGVMYFSGHGAQADGENYLIPVGADIRSKAELQEFAYNARIILGEMEDAGNRVNILILDACRNNPFKGFRGGADGLAMMSGPKGSLIAYATAPGSVAADGASGNRRNGTYTGYLKQYLTQPGLTVEQLFKKVRESVIAQNPEQVPWENSSITGEFCFAGCDAGSTPAVAPTETPASAPNPQQQEASFWNDIKASQDAADFRAYLKKYPDGDYTDLALNKIRRLSQVGNVAPDSHPVTPESPPKPAIAATSNSFGIEMIRLPSLGISMGKYEVTQGQWRAVMGNNPSYFSSCGEDCPVEQVSWDDVQAFIKKLNMKTGGNFRLPTEKEWEKACQAGDKFLLGYDYCGSNKIGDVAWYDGNSGVATHPVGRKQPNAWGLYDMSGNVWEWTADCLDDRDYCGSLTMHEGATAATRGGSWHDIPQDVRSKPDGHPDPNSYGVGFRLAK